MDQAPKAPASNWLVLIFLASSFALLYLPAYLELSRTIWSSDEQGHGPIILALCAWLLWNKRNELGALAPQPWPYLGWPMLVFFFALYAIGRSQNLIMFTVGSQIGVLMALLLIFKGPQALKLVWFPLFFMCFMVPLPEALVAAITGPLKSAVSAVASNLLYLLGYPIGRSGVTLTVGPYQLLVADACAGLNSMFTLEALGMIYMHQMKYTNPARNAALALMLVPTAFLANVVRVSILVLVTYHFGDEAGQGFVHGFAGMVLFMVALLMMLVLDKALGLVFQAHRSTR